MSRPRVTVAELERLCEKVNRLQNRPTVSYTRLAGPPYNVANVGHIGIGIWAPGDGWARYSVEETVNEAGGVSIVQSGMTARECRTYLEGVLDTLYTIAQVARRAAEEAGA